MKCNHLNVYQTFQMQNHQRTISCFKCYISKSTNQNSCNTIKLSFQSVHSLLEYVLKVKCKYKWNIEIKSTQLITVKFNCWLSQLGFNSFIWLDWQLRWVPSVMHDGVSAQCLKTNDDLMWYKNAERSII